MPARKSAPRKASQSKATSSAKLNAGSIPPYGVPIREAIARGNAAEMKKVATSARKYLKDVQTAVAQLDRAMSKRKS
jgi:hypothetical protein